MSSPILTADLDALAQNWRALDRLSAAPVRTGAVVKANAYGLGVAAVGRRLNELGVKQFFVAVAGEGAALRKAVGPAPRINLFNGHMHGDTELIRTHHLTPMLNSPSQFKRHRDALPEYRFGIQLDTGMSRLGFTGSDWATLRNSVLAAGPALLMSHLACADEPDHPMNRRQLAKFRDLTDGLNIPRSLSATGGILLGPEYHFDLTRPGIGLYGGLPYADARAVVSLKIPVIQTRTLRPGDSVGYGNSWIAKGETRVATIAAGYADGLLRALGGGARLYHGDEPCPLIGRVSMDLITIDISHLSQDPVALDILCPGQNIDQLARAAGTIGYEILTALGSRYQRRYKART